MRARGSGAVGAAFCPGWRERAGGSGLAAWVGVRNAAAAAPADRRFDLRKGSGQPEGLGGRAPVSDGEGAKARGPGRAGIQGSAQGAGACNDSRFGASAACHPPRPSHLCRCLTRV